jgi:hypothetical protein
MQLSNQEQARARLRAKSIMSLSQNQVAIIKKSLLVILSVLKISNISYVVYNSKKSYHKASTYNGILSV